ncbi:hypothetical protein PVAND_014055 [Polypedilum vanderplanki]|uniref:Uncharacterized protein n=1 Tax=Polypedilum vanderplanki TaxID=319348 RepID=A0A9J6CSH4_POLVA|nr:hypothetical protein PVAND_014055 [Polypedilum vanderplanki]
MVRSRSVVKIGAAKTRSASRRPRTASKSKSDAKATSRAGRKSRTASKSNADRSPSNSRSTKMKPLANSTMIEEHEDQVKKGRSNSRRRRA